MMIISLYYSTDNDGRKNSSFHFSVFSFFSTHTCVCGDIHCVANNHFVQFFASNNIKA